MTLRFAAALALAGALAAACGPTEQAPPAGPATASRSTMPDIHSFARPAEVRVTHVALDLRADFDAKQLAGSATLQLARAAGSKEVVLDTSDLTIEGVSARSGQALTFALGEADKNLGRALTVALPDGVNEIVVRYRTSPAASALQWLEPSQTAGKRRPYFYSQGQAILTRTWIPTQDSPGIRQTYTAKVTVPSDLRAVMSAEHLTPEGVASPNGERAYEFRLTQAIPPYLIALAVGDIAFKAVGPRTGVYAEPTIVEAAASEFAEMEQMVTAAEALLGPYDWGRYDVLVLPPSFPFGGMENPRLTFATPTVLAGDRSLVTLVAHELAHSWSGNLVTNATWADFWLNEGFTTYVESRIMEAIYGVDRARMLEVLGRQDLLDEITRLGPTAPDTRLRIDLAERNPDDGVTSIAYEKGQALLRLIETTVGRERFDAYLKGYLRRHAFQSITTDTFLDDIRANLIKGDAALEAQLRLEEWIDKPGLPSNATVPTSDALARAEAQAKAFASGASTSSLAVKGWTTQEWQRFLTTLPESLTSAQLAELDKAFSLSAQGNSEVLFAWLRIAVREHYQPAMPAVERFLTGQGRRKFLRPLYEDLIKADWGKAEAKRIYARARPLYHAVSTATLDGIVK